MVMMHKNRILMPKIVRTGIVAIAIVTILSMVSCTPAEQKSYNDFSSFVDATEQEAPNYTEQDWEVSTQTYEAYKADLDAFSQMYTPEQNREIGRMKARYHKVVLKYYYNKASNFVDNMSHQMEGYLDELGGDNADLLDDEILDALDDVTDIF